MNLKYENQKYKQGFQYIIGCDEVGKGSLAGPVVACAVILDCARMSKNDKNLMGQIKDSKLLTPTKREKLSIFIKSSSLAWAMAEVYQETIDKINIHNATLLAMKKAAEKVLGQVSSQTANILAAVDGKFVISGLNPRTRRPSSSIAKCKRSTTGLRCGTPPRYSSRLRVSQEAIVDGDNKILSIAAASILAKVHRDNLMRRMHQKYPIYNFAQHKGYGTLHHREMIIKHGISPVHRLTFCKNLAV